MKRMLRPLGRPLWLLLLTVPAARASGTADFTLTQAIPSDAFLAVHSRTHAGQEFLNKQYARVWEAVRKQQFDRDLKRFLKESQGATDTAASEEFDARWQRMTDLALGVNWCSLGERESAFAMKLGFPNAEFVALFKPPADEVARDFEGLTAILKTMVDLQHEMLNLATDGEGESVVHTVGLPTGPFSMSVTLARQKDTILLGFGSAFVEQALAMLRGQGGTSLASTPRFQEALKSLPAPKDELVFFDCAKLMTQLRAMVSQAISMAEQGAADDPEAGARVGKARTMINKLVDGLDMFEYSASVSATDGLRTTEDSITLLREDARSRMFYASLYGPGPVPAPLKYVPREAGGVNVSSGFDLLSLYKAIVRFVEEDMPDGEAALAQWNAFQEQMQIDVEKEVLGWIQGNCVQFSVPGPTSYSAREFVFMLRVKDEQAARAFLDRVFGMVEPLLAEQQGGVREADIEGAEGFRSVIHPMLAMMGLKAATAGVHDGWLFLGSSPEIIARSLAVAEGKAESFTDNERFRKEGVPLGSAGVSSLSFTDQTRLGEELGQALQLLPFVIRMAGQQEIARNPFAQLALNVMTKLGNVVRTLDFFQSSSSVSTFDGRKTVTKTVYNYREPPPRMVPAGKSTDEKNQETEKPVEQGTGSPGGG